MSPYLSPPFAAIVMIGFLVGAAYVVAVLDGITGTLVARRPLRLLRVLGGPLETAALLLLQGRTTTEHPDAQAWAIAPALLAGLAAVGLAVIPIGPNTSVADPAAGFVLYSAAIAYVMVSVYLHGWSANSTMPLIGAYRFIAMAFAFQIPFLLVLLAPALPAESLAIGAIVEAQESLWNVVRQPLGLPIFLVVSAAATFSLPLDFPDAADLGGGTSAEVSGSHRLAWRGARAALLVMVAAMGASAFLGGWQGPWLPGWLWVLLKTVFLLTLLIASSHALARLRIERFIVFAWVVLLPLSLVNIFLAGGLLL
ncbi:MAG: complex I subunit 1 family protein [Actinomycetota bacterium]